MDGLGSSTLVHRAVHQHSNACLLQSCLTSQCLTIQPLYSKSFSLWVACFADFTLVAEYQRQVAQHRASDTLVPRQLAVPDAERIARKKKRRQRRWLRQQKALAGQPVRVLEGYSAVPSPTAWLAPSFASKTGTDSYDDTEEFILDEDSSSGEGRFDDLLRDP